MHEVVTSQWFWPETGLQVPQVGAGGGVAVTRNEERVRRRRAVMALRFGMSVVDAFLSPVCCFR